MKELTKAEEQIMMILWKIGKGFVKDILSHFDEPKPAYNTVSTIVRILQDKGFVTHKAYGRTHQYYPVISKTEYSKMHLGTFINSYFSNSFEQMVSFFAHEKQISVKEMEEILIAHVERDRKAKREKMNQFFLYSFKAGVFLSVFYLVYFLFLSRDTAYLRNRAYILITLIFHGFFH
jgi:BlaI family transcriptional regulator, penicillinase repressor